MSPESSLPLPLLPPPLLFFSSSYLSLSLIFFVKLYTTNFCNSWKLNFTTNSFFCSSLFFLLLFFHSICISFPLSSFFLLIPPLQLLPASASLLCSSSFLCHTYYLLSSSAFSSFSIFHFPISSTSSVFPPFNYLHLPLFYLLILLFILSSTSLHSYLLFPSSRVSLLPSPPVLLMRQREASLGSPKAFVPDSKLWRSNSNSSIVLVVAMIVVVHLYKAGHMYYRRIR